MPVPDSASQRQQAVVEAGGLIAAGLGHAAQAFGSADGVFDLNAAAGVSGIFGSLGVGQGRVRAFFTAPGLAVGQVFRGQVVVSDQAQIAQIGQQFKKVEQAQIGIKLVFKRLVVVGRPAGSGSQVVGPR